LRSTLLMNRNKHSRNDFFFCFLYVSIALNCFTAPCPTAAPASLSMHVVSRNFAKTLVANLNMVSCCDVTNSVYTVTVTTIPHCSIPELGRVASSQAVAPVTTRPLSARHWSQAPVRKNLVCVPSAHWTSFIMRANLSSSFDPVLSVHCLAALDLGAGVGSHSIVSSSWTIRPCSPWGGRWSGHWRPTWLTVCSEPHSQAADGAIPRVCKRERKRHNGAEAVKPDPRCSWQGHLRRVGAEVGDESTKSRSALQSLRIPPVIRPERRSSDIFVRWTDEMCSGCKWVSWFEMPCIPTLWTGGC